MCQTELVSSSSIAIDASDGISPMVGGGVTGAIILVAVSDVLSARCIISMLAVPYGSVGGHNTQNILLSIQQQGKIFRHNKIAVSNAPTMVAQAPT